MRIKLKNLPRRNKPHSKSLARKSEIKRSWGPVPGIRPDGKLSKDLTHMNESILPSIRTPRVTILKVDHWDIRKGDVVQVIDPSHKDVGKKGVVLLVLRPSHSLVVKDINVLERPVRVFEEPMPKLITTEHPIHAVRVALVDPKTGLPTTVEYKYLEDGTKVRVSTRSGEIIPAPPRPKKEVPPEARLPGPRDTPLEVVVQKTYKDDGLVSLLKQLNLDTSMLEQVPDTIKKYQKNQ
mmetsp:Transcript_1485/g.2468  ORF Transcript_1485/g.2468 Transcript_1485/m.2468 type:complete len:237 (-) Transcript_1485:28-738(-)